MNDYRYRTKSLTLRNSDPKIVYKTILDFIIKEFSSKMKNRLKGNLSFKDVIEEFSNDRYLKRMTIAGGFFRDMYLDRVPKDIDIYTNLPTTDLIFDNSTRYYSIYKTDKSTGYVNGFLNSTDSDNYPIIDVLNLDTYSDKSVYEILDSYDIIVSKIGMDLTKTEEGIINVNLVYHKHWKDSCDYLVIGYDDLDKILREEDPDRVLLRAMRYLSYGFQFEILDDLVTIINKVHKKVYDVTYQEIISGLSRSIII